VKVSVSLAHVLVLLLNLKVSNSLARVLVFLLSRMYESCLNLMRSAAPNACFYPNVNNFP